MITEDIIKELYGGFETSPACKSSLDIDHFLEVLSPHYIIERGKDTLIVKDLGDLNPFRIVLIKAINNILEFDRFVAIVLNSHIIFFDKRKKNVNIHFRYLDVEQEEAAMEAAAAAKAKAERKNFFQKLFSRKSKK